jgi:two-component sensor histidine kinase
VIGTPVTLIQAELEQGMAPEDAARIIQGAVIRLDAHRTQALSLIVHELVTNALKYGGLSARGCGMTIGFFVLPGTSAEAPQLWIDWHEKFSPAEDGDAAKPGFGSRLIEATVSTDLSGTLQRVFSVDGLRIVIQLPLA